MECISLFQKDKLICLHTFKLKRLKFYLQTVCNYPYGIFLLYFSLNEFKKGSRSTHNTVLNCINNAKNAIGVFCIVAQTEQLKEVEKTSVKQCKVSDWAIRRKENVKNILFSKQHFSCCVEQNIIFLFFSLLLFCCSLFFYFTKIIRFDVQSVARFRSDKTYKFVFVRQPRCESFLD